MNPVIIAVRAAKLLVAAVLAAAAAVPANAIYRIVDGAGSVTRVTTRPGFGNTGSVAVGDSFAFSFAFDPANGVLLQNSGPGFQLFQTDSIAVSASAGDYEFAFNGARPTAVAVGTGFRIFPGDTVSQRVFNQTFYFTGYGLGNTPVALTPLGGRVELSLNSAFKLDLAGATPTFADIRDPKNAAISQFNFAFYEGQTLMATFDGTFTGAFYTAAIPEPSAWAMMILGFGVVGAARRRKAFALA